MNHNLKITAFLLCLFCFLQYGWAQSPELFTFNADRLSINRTGMTILGSWAVGNIVSGSLLSLKATGSQKYFHQMNAGWNLVNLGIAAFGYLSEASVDPGTLDLYDSVQAHFSMEKTLLFNAGLDIGYVAGGFFLMEKAKNVTKNEDRFKGFGRSLVLQGAFLFVFDLGMYLTHHHHGSTLRELIGHLQLDPNNIGFHWQF